MLIIEGPDHVGKTTLAHKCASLLSWHYEGSKYRHLSRLPADFHLLYDHLKLVEPMVVQDRFHISQTAYACTDVNRQKIPRLWHEMIDGAIAFVGGMTVVLYADSGAWLVEQIKNKPKSEMFTTQQIYDVNRVYQTIAEGHYPYMHVDMIFKVGKHGYVSDIQAATIVSHYLKRQGMLIKYELEKDTYGLYQND